MSPWPFAKWGVDLISPLLQGRYKMKFAIVAIDYYTKWVEVEPLQEITEARTTGFIWRNIICRFGIPHSLVSDNGTQFDSAGLKKLCLDLGIHKHFSSVAHPQSNGQVEAVNKIIKNNLERKLNGAKGAWTSWKLSATTLRSEWWQTKRRLPDHIIPEAYLLQAAECLACIRQSLVRKLSETPLTELSHPSIFCLSSAVRPSSFNLSCSSVSACTWFLRSDNTLIWWDIGPPKEECWSLASLIPKAKCCLKRKVRNLRIRTLPQKILWPYV
ncbi:hypothetical protein UlMin_015913 [Ulmus minor]